MRNNKESKFLLFLLAVMVIYLFYSQLIAPKIEANEKLETEIDFEQEQLLKKYEIAGSYDVKIKTLKEQKDTLGKLTALYYSRSNQQEEFIDLLHGFMAGENLQLRTISSSDYANSISNEYPGTVSPYVAYYPDDPAGSSVVRNLSSETEESQKLPRVDKMDIHFEYSGSYEDIQNFFGQLGGVEHLLICNDLEVVLSQGVVFEEEEEDESPNTNKPDQEEEEEEIEPDEMAVTISVLRLGNIGSLETEVENLDDLKVVMPKNLADESYRKMYTFENLTRAIKGIFSGDDKKSDSGDKK